MGPEGSAGTPGGLGGKEEGFSRFRFYCDYCDTYLTHDSPSVRKTHCSGRKHKENVKDYYQKWMEEQAQSLIDKTSKANLSGTPYCIPFISSAWYHSPFPGKPIPGTDHPQQKPFPDAQSALPWRSLIPCAHSPQFHIFCLPSSQFQS
uniref:Uncharacterized protein n=1 Tax=Melopsittacus undulatus TaxID=13146 RepID=A0A8C6JRS1_MELUD